ncbi:hypothetical protein L1S35_07965 [Flavobacterium sp. AS60]|uniref:hypothetical protein n=1 Tax=Flavobacterium anseongense TaxID=2910677 RepID=UPI001F3753F0|nr:hypothetical protein [Flavobacterium sp. AS60]MCF6129604.1 hypothetical protein [Flavobacterium sp. AS60]
MILLILLTAAFAATALKTIFSYATAQLFRQPYQEPYLLAALVSHFNVSDTKTNRYIGISIQYFLGLLCVIGFQALLSNGLMTLTYDSILIYGSLIGILSMIGWLFIFMQARSKPQMNVYGYYTQLFMANIVFAFAMAGCYIII